MKGSGEVLEVRMDGIDAGPHIMEPSGNEVTIDLESAGLDLTPLGAASSGETWPQSLVDAVPGGIDARSSARAPLLTSSWEANLDRTSAAAVA